MEARRDAKRKWNRNHPYKKNRFLIKTTTQNKNDYGTNRAAPDMTRDAYKMAKKEFLKNLDVLTFDKDRIERETRL